MKKLLLGVACCLAAFSLSAAELNWITSLPDAQAKAKADDKLIFMEFTGSDWCPPCKKLHSDVLESDEFAAFVKDKYVLVELDFPRRKEQSDELKAANKALSEKYEIRGFPTVIVLDSDGNELFRKVGYGGGSAADYIAEVKSGVSS
jgi:protein disulfide-isomerase